MPSIDLDRICCSYGSRLALREVNLRFESGSWSYVLGPSGSGKTTLLRAIAGLEPIRSGLLRIDDRIASNSRIAMAPHERRVGFVFQEMSLWPHLSNAANVALAVDSLRISRRERREKAVGLLDRLGIGHLADKFPAQVSGGEAQRVVIARALAARPAILLLDEPTTHLDLHLRDETMTLLRRLHEEEKLTTLCVLHEIDRRLQAAERTVILEEGSVAHDGPLESLNPDSQSKFIIAVRRGMGKRHES